MEKTKSLVVRMSEEEHSLLKQKADKRGISMSEIVRENIYSGVKEDKKIVIVFQRAFPLIRIKKNL